MGMTTGGLTPIQKWAHGCVKDALMYGKLLRGPCEGCGAARAQAHHDDYSRPLDVRWLCVRCHRAWHRSHQAANANAPLPAAASLRAQRIRDFYAARGPEESRKRRRGRRG